MKLVDYLRKFADGVRNQIYVEDPKYWMDTWESYPAEGEVQYVMDRIREYVKDFESGVAHFPWLKVASHAVIGWARGTLDFDKARELHDYLLDPFFFHALGKQLEADQKRWGDTWKERPLEGQVGRAMARFQDYEAQFRNAGVSFPWLKVAGEALIGWVRETYPDYVKR